MSLYSIVNGAKSKRRNIAQEVMAVPMAVPM
jgi:hypothetical protein